MIKVRILIVLAIVFVTTNSQSYSCPPSKNNQDLGDDIFEKGNFLFVGKVIEAHLIETTKSRSCLSIAYKPIQRIFGFPPAKIGVTFCGQADEFRDYISKPKNSFAVFIPARIGQEGLVGLTPNLPPKKNGNNFTSYYRVLNAGCFPVWFNFENIPKKEVAALVNSFRKSAYENKFIPKTQSLPVPSPRP